MYCCLFIFITRGGLPQQYVRRGDRVVAMIGKP